MTDNQQEPARMGDFAVEELDSEHREIANKIQPLPANVVPSEEFLRRARAHLVAAIEGAGRRAA